MVENSDLSSAESNEPAILEGALAAVSMQAVESLGNAAMSEAMNAGEDLAREGVTQASLPLEMGEMLVAPNTPHVEVEQDQSVER